MRSGYATTPRTIITVTPVAWGLSSPGVLTAGLGALVWWGAQHVPFVHHYAGLILAVVAGPAALVLGTRTWRWRSHHIQLTTVDIRSEGGILRRRGQRVHLADVLTTSIERRGLDRLRRTGVVVVHATSGDLVLGPLRHPDALVRFIDSARRSLAATSPTPIATSFGHHRSPTARRAHRFGV